MTKQSVDYEKYNEEKYKNNFWTINRSKYKWFSNYVKLKIFKKWFLNQKKREVFLDVGGGVGNWAFHFIPYYKKVIVMDVSKNALNQIPEKQIIKKFGSALKVPLQNNSVDSILLADVFEHILPKDIPKMMSELNRILKKEGRIVIFTSQYGYGITLVINRILGKMNGRIMKSEIDEGHLNRLKFKEFKIISENANLEIEDYYHYSIIFQQATDFIKDSIAKVIDKIKGNKATREGQVIKDKLKVIDNPSFLFKTIFGILSFISYLDILLFGKIIPGGTIFLKLKKSEN